MKIEVDDEIFSKLAKDLKTTPENVVKIFLDHASDLPHSVWIDAIQEKSSLDNALKKLMKNAEVAFTLGDLIEKIVGDHDYIIDDGGYLLEEGIIWVSISFLEGTVLNMGSITLQFGKDPGIVAIEYVDPVEIDNIGELVGIIEEDLDDSDPTFDLDTHDEVSLEHTGDSIVITVQINWKDELNLPRVAEIDEIMRKIKEIILENKSLS